MCSNFSNLLPRVGNTCLLPPSFLINIARELPMSWIFLKNKFVALMIFLFYIFLLIHWIVFLKITLFPPFNSFFFFLVLWDGIRSILFIVSPFLMFGLEGMHFSLGTAFAALQKVYYIISLLFSSNVCTFCCVCSIYTWNWDL